MAARNNIAMHYPRRAKRQLVYWREVDGVIPARIQERAAKAWPDLPAIHNNTWAAWCDSPEYRELREALTAEAEANRDLDGEWARLQSGEGDDYHAATKFLLLKRAHEAAAAGELDAKSLKNLSGILVDDARVELARQKAEADRRLADAERRHEAEAAELAADNEALQRDVETLTGEVDRLAELCQRAGIDTSGRRQGELSEAAKARIRQLYGIK